MDGKLQSFDIIELIDGTRYAYFKDVYGSEKIIDVVGDEVLSSKLMSFCFTMNIVRNGEVVWSRETGVDKL